MRTIRNLRPGRVGSVGLLALCAAAIGGWGVLTSDSHLVHANEWTADDCSACHEDVVSRFTANPHHVADLVDRPGSGGDLASCIACHGDPTAHINEGGSGPIRSFGEGMPPMQTNQVCMDCHGDTHPRFEATAHARMGMDCTSCHTVHGADGPPLENLMRPVEVSTDSAIANPSVASGVCIECHAGVAAEFQFNERHRLEEGILDCSSCHDPHEPQTRLQLGGFKQEQCLQCHADKGGPYVFEHGAVRVEGCTACHTPHGSPNRHMLEHQDVAELCYSCHAGVPQFHFGFNPTAPPRFGLDTNCTNCHSTIHGSQVDPYFLK